MPTGSTDWNALQVAYSAGIGLRELARNTGVNVNSLMTRARREGWTKQITEAKQMAAEANALERTASQGAAVSLYERGQRHVKRMAQIAENTLPTVEKMLPEEVLDSVEKVDRLDRLARRQYGLDEQAGQRIGLQINFLSHPTTEERGVTLDAEVEKLPEGP